MTAYGGWVQGVAKGDYKAWASEKLGASTGETLHRSGLTVLFCPPVSVIGIEWCSKANSRLRVSCYVHVLVMRRITYVINV